MDLKRAIELVELLGECKELFLIGKGVDGNYTYSCTDIEDADELIEILKSIISDLQDAIDRNTNCSLDDILKNFNIDDSKN